MANHYTKIYIVGSGAIGKALAVSLKLENKNVVIIRGSIDNKPTCIEKMIIELNDNSRLEAELEVSTLSNFTELTGIVVLACKSYGNLHLSSALKDKIGNSPIVILQNGLGIEQPFVDNGFRRIYRCILFATSQVVENRIRFRPVSDSLVGIIRSDYDDLTAIVSQLNSQNFPFKAEENIQVVIWKKAIVNSVFNSVCPLLETDNGIFHRNETALEIAKKIITECIDIARDAGVSLKSEEVVESLLFISKSSDGQLISTYQDILNKRRTEIDTLNFAILNIAKQLNKEDAVRETRLLGELTKLKSELNK